MSEQTATATAPVTGNALNLAVGARVFFVPGPEHARMRGADGRYQYSFRYLQEAPGTHRKGQVIEPEKMGNLEIQGGKLVTATGHQIEAHAPINRWPAWVVAVNADGSVDLDIADPKCFMTEDQAKSLKRERLFITHHVPDREYVCQDTSHPGFGKKIHASAPGIPHDPTGKRPHSFHLMEE